MGRLTSILLFEARGEMRDFSAGKKGKKEIYMVRDSSSGAI